MGLNNGSFLQSNSMAASSINNNNNNDTSSPASPIRSHFRTTVTLQNWWLTNPQSNVKTLGVAGVTFQHIHETHINGAVRCFSSAPIFKRHDIFELETDDGVFVILQGLINKEKSLESGFSLDVVRKFIIGFPYNWEEFSTISPKEGSAAESVSIAQDYVKDSTDGHADSVDNPPQHCDSADVILSDKTSTEPIIKAGNNGLCEDSPLTREIDGSSLEMSPIIRNNVDSSRVSKRLGVSSRRMTRSMAKKACNKKSSSSVHDDVSSLEKVTPFDPKELEGCDILKMDNDNALSNKKAVNVVDHDTSENMKTNSTFSGGARNEPNEIPTCSQDMHFKIKSKRKRNDQNAGAAEDSNVVFKEIDVNDNIRVTRTKKKTYQNTIRSDDVSNKGVDKKNVMNSRTRSKSQSKPTSGRSRCEHSKRKHLSSYSTPKSSKVSKEGFVSANISPLSSFGGKKSRSGRFIIPTLEFWRNQKLVYDEDRQVCGVQEPM
ncbi:uncharacterized protein [Rutidosis leptorrhynchoides]|uniref:uncharacterized protein isoform X2 n=1 Tax=Rutidosis leptorrhynchoides TaxID=125765 RepID=UPI003A997BAD